MKIMEYVGNNPLLEPIQESDRAQVKTETPRECKSAFSQTEVVHGVPIKIHNHIPLINCPMEASGAEGFGHGPAFSPTMRVQTHSNRSHNQG